MEALNSFEERADFSRLNKREDDDFATPTTFHV